MRQRSKRVNCDFRFFRLLLLASSTLALLIQVLFPIASHAQSVQAGHRDRAAAGADSARQGAAGSPPKPANSADYATGTGIGVSGSPGSGIPQSLEDLRASAPMLPGATNGVIGPPGADVTVVDPLRDKPASSLPQNDILYWLAAPLVSLILFLLFTRKKGASLWELSIAAALVFVLAGIFLGLYFLR